MTPTDERRRATYAVTMGGLTDADGVIPLAVGSNVINIEVTAEAGSTAKTYTVTVTRAEALAPTVAIELSSRFSRRGDGDHRHHVLRQPDAGHMTPTWSSGRRGGRRHLRGAGIRRQSEHQATLMRTTRSAPGHLPATARLATTPWRSA